MKIIGEVCAVFELSLANLWAQMFTDGTSLGTIPVQDIIISISEKDVFRPIILAAAIVFEDRKVAPAVCGIVTRTIEASGNHLAGVKEVMTRMYGAAKADS